jgi:heme/copper-type cytochrome/quinol oxidase subunit 2
VRALWVVANPSALHTGHMTVTTAATAFITGAAGFIGSVLLLALPLVVAQAPETDSTRTIDVTLSRYAFSPERIEVRRGERVRLNVVSVDGTHGFQVKEFGLNVRTPIRGRTVTVDVTPKEAGTFQINCSEYCGTGHSRMKAWLIVTPGA